MTLKEDINKIKKFIDESELKEKNNKKRKKKFKLPKKVSANQRRKSWITVMLINENGNVDFKKVPIEDQVITIEKIPRLAAAGYVMYWKKNPLIILPSWSVEPFSPLEHYQRSLITGSNSAGYRLLMAKMESEVISSKTKMGSWLKWMVGIGLVAIIVYAVITGGNA